MDALSTVVKRISGKEEEKSTCKDLVTGMRRLFYNLYKLKDTKRQEVLRFHESLKLNANITKFNIYELQDKLD